MTTDFLPSGTLLHGGTYRIVKTLGQGGFGITYQAEQIGLDRLVAIKEFFLKDFCERQEDTQQITMGTANSRATVERYREKFLKEARNMASLKHPHIVKVYDIFEENGTAYFTMEYCPGGSLSQLVSQKGCLPEDEARQYILQLASALDYLHKRQMNHLDVKPANVMLDEQGQAILIDFGLSKQYDAHGEQTSTTPVGISEGYAPMEQYRQGGVAQFSPETDVYALGATFYKLLTGETPPSASDVYDEGGIKQDALHQHGVSEASIQIITRAMTPNRRQRLADATEFLRVLDVEARPVTVPTPATDEHTVPMDALREEDGATMRMDDKTSTPEPAPTPMDTPKNATEPAQPRQKKGGCFKKILIVALVAMLLLTGLLAMVGIGVWYFSQTDSTTDDADTICEVAEVACDSVLSIDEEPAPERVQEIELPATKPEPTVTPTAAPEPAPTTTHEEPAPAATTGATTQEVVDDNRIYDVVEESAQFPGGESALMSWLSSHLKYPNICQEQGIQGRVTVSFVVEKDGRITDVRVLRSPDDNLSKEAMRVVSSMPRWKPARQGGKNVRSHFNLPVTFRLG